MNDNDDPGYGAERIAALGALLAQALIGWWLTPLLRTVWGALRLRRTSRGS
jgi:hypothetical protein